MTDAVDWRAVTFATSSFCSKGGCLEVGRGPDGLFALRSTGGREYPPIVFNAHEWSAFVAGVKTGEFDLG